MIPSKWSITSKFDPALQYTLLVYRNVSIETPDDVQAWVDDLERRINHDAREKLDLVIDLSGLNIKPAVLKLYDEQRQVLMARFVRHVYRYSGNALVRTRLLTSATLAGQTANVYGTFDEAIAALKADRAAGR